jgi:hypothetical protein
MGLLSPWLMGGVLAVGLPVWLHLLRKHSTTPLRFSSLMFFEAREQSSVQYRRLDYLLLFALRAALLVMLALAFAGPYIMGNPASAAGGRRLTVVAVDNSFSMSEGGRFDRAKREAARVLSGLGAADPAQVLSFSRDVQLMGEATTDPSTLRGQLQSIRQSASRNSYGDLVRALRSIAQSSKLALDVHVFTDMQKSSMPGSFVEIALPLGARLTPHQVVDSRTPNWAVESVAAPKILQPGSVSKVQATIAGYGTEAAELRVSLAVRDKVIETRPVHVPEGGRASVEFASLDAPYGWSQAEVRIEGRDSLRADDRFRFAVQRADARAILFVHEQRDTRSPGYFRAALESAAPSSFSVDTRTPSQVGGLTPSRYSFVVLSNVSSLPEDFERALRAHLRSGGSALVTVGPAASASGKLPLVEGTISESHYASRAAERFQAVDWLDTAHPSVRLANRWEGVRFYQVFRVEAPGARVLARVTDQTPILIEKQEGAGRVLILTSTLDNVANDFPLHSSFVPFVDQTARYLGGFDEGSGSLQVGAYYELRRTRGEGGATDVLDPAGRRVLDLSATSTALGFTLVDEGFYNVRRGSGRDEMVAVNADRRESDLDVIPKETLALWQSTGEDAQRAGGVEQMQRRPIHLGWYVLLIAFLIGLAESVVSRRYLAIRKEAA